MTPTLRLINNDTLVISASGLDKLRTCPKLWWHTYGYRRVAAIPNAAAAAGKAFDAAMNLRYTKARSQGVGEPLQDMMLDSVDASFAGLDLPPEEHRTAARYKDVVRAYNEHYQEEPFEVLAVQMPFEVELGEVYVGPHFWATMGLPPLLNEQGQARKLKVHLHGILDLLIQHTAAGLTLVCDTKTSKDWGTMQQTSFENHAQLKAYSWATPRIAPEAERLGLTAGLSPAQQAALARLPRKVDGALVNVVVIRPPYKREGSADRANAKPRNEFHRFIIHYTAERLEEWRRDTLFTIEQAMQWVARGHFPQNEKACANIYGKKCPYMDVCTAPEDSRPMMLESDMFVDYDGGPLGGAR